MNVFGHACDVGPYSVVCVDSEAADAAQQVAGQYTCPIVLGIRTDGQHFLDALALELFSHSTTLMQILVSEHASLSAVFADVTVMLYDITTRVVQFVREFFVRQDEWRRDYDHTLHQLEQEYTEIEEKLRHAGTVNEATELCEQAMAVLQRIEALYYRNHDTRVTPMPLFLSDLKGILNTSRRRIMNDSFLLSEEEVLQHNAQLDAAMLTTISLEPAGKEHRQRHPAGKAARQAAQAVALPTTSTASERIDHPKVPESPHTLRDHLLNDQTMADTVRRGV